MLKRIEIWDFESHEHTILDDLSEGLNLICGESNSGKTSMVRALKLAAYNDFDPASVRVGKKTCKVRVESSRGTVQVERGKGVNLWEVTPNGGKKEEFRSPGVAIVPKAAEIVGLKMVQLGDVDVPVNIMDQLENHFMLSSVGGDKASGSMRAQIVDEISGLSGIEGVIKDVSLDRHRFGREVKRTEDEMNDVISRLHDDDRIASDESVVKEAQKLVEDRDECVETADVLVELHNEHSATVTSVNDLENRLSGMPDHKRAVKLSVEVDECLDVVDKAQQNHDESMKVDREVKLLEDRESELNKTGDPSKHIESCNKALNDAQNAARVHEDCTETAKEVKSREKWLSGIKDPSASIKKSESAIDKASKMNDMYLDVVSVKRVMDGLELDLVEAGKTANEIDKEMKELLAEVKVCPLTLGPVSDECLNQAGGVS